MASSKSEQAPIAAVFTATDAGGARWTFNPATGKYAVETDTLKASSNDPTKLADKLAGPKRGRPGATQAELRDVELVSFAKRGDKPVLVKLKLGWSEKRQAPVAVKYRLDGENEGWRSWGAEDLVCLDPAAMDAAFVAAQVLQAQQGALARCALAAEQVMAAAFAQALESKDASATLVVEHDGKAQWSNDARQACGNSLVLPAGCPVAVVDEQRLLEGWRADEAGRWRQDRTRVAFRPGAHPRFSVEMQVPGDQGGAPAWEEVHNTPSWRVALALGQATEALTAAGGQGLACWAARKDWLTDGIRRSWPVAIDVLGVAPAIAAPESALRQMEAYVLERKAQGSKPTGWQWTGRRVNSMSPDRAWWWRGDEIQAQAHLQALYADLACAQRVVAGGLDPEAARKARDEALQAHTQQALARAWEAADDGEALPTGVERMAHYQRRAANWEATAGQSEAVVAFAQTANAHATAFSKTLAGGAPPARKAPKA